MSSGWPTGGSGNDVQTDLCIVGGGPAGITLAREWIGRDRRVTIIESGGYGHEPETQALDAGRIASNYHGKQALARGRRRQFGGTTNLWIYHTRPDDGRRYARAVRPQAIDFEPRPGHDETGWPFSVDELRPYHERATAVWAGGPTTDDVEAWRGETAPFAADSGLATQVIRHGPSDVFSLRDRDELTAADNVTVLVSCTVLVLESDTTGRTITRAVVAAPDGSRFTVSAKAFVLAGGGIENAQLLLLSDVGRPGGPGNQHDVVGRYLTDHPEFRFGMLQLDGPAAIDRVALYDIRRVDDQLVSAALTLPEATKRAEGLRNVGIAMAAQVAPFGSETHRSFATLRAATRRQRPRDTLRHLRVLATHPRDTLSLVRDPTNDYHESHGGWSRPEVDRSRLHALELYASTEQTADRDNRVTLDDRRDALGRRRARVQWTWSRADRDDVERSLVRLEEAIGHLGLGVFQRWVSLEGANRPFDIGFHHPMGSTRMHPDPTCGVVDTDQRVHGTTNLFVTGSSVFPSGHGFANPTLTILALTLRLADELAAFLG